VRKAGHYRLDCAIAYRGLEGANPSCMPSQTNFFGAFVTMIIAFLAAAALMADSTTAMQVASTPASTPAAAAAAAPNAKPAQADAKRVICRNEPTLGTRLPTKKCRTVASMAERQQEDRANLEKLQIVTPERTN